MGSNVKNYVVEIESYCTVIVTDAQNEDEALDFALDEISKGDFEIVEFSAREITPKDDMELLKRDAQLVI